MSASIIVRDQCGRAVTFALNESGAATALLAQLPLTVETDSFGSCDEKIFYPPRPLPLENAVLESVRPGAMVYYAPWGCVMLLYGARCASCRLYALGRAVQGAEQIEHLHGMLKITRKEVD